MKMDNPEEVEVRKGRAEGEAGEGEDETRRPKDQMEVSINGHSGPTIKFQIGVAVLVNAVIAIMGIGAAGAVMQASVTDLQRKNAAMEVTASKTLEAVVELKTSVGYLTDEIRYYREQIDKVKESRERGK